MNPDDLTAKIRATSRPRQHRHRWESRQTDDGVVEVCAACWRTRDAEASRKGRNNRARGNAIERDWCHRLGLRLTGKYGDAADGDSTILIGQCKSLATGRFPGWMADELAKLAALRTGKAAILGVVEAPGPGRKARRLVVLEESDWLDLHGPVVPHG